MNLTLLLQGVLCAVHKTLLPFTTRGKMQVAKEQTYASFGVFGNEHCFFVFNTEQQTNTNGREITFQQYNRNICIIQSGSLIYKSKYCIIFWSSACRCRELFFFFVSQWCFYLCLLYLSVGLGSSGILHVIWTEAWPLVRCVKLGIQCHHVVIRCKL